MFFILQCWGATDEELAQWDQESKTTHFVAQVRQVFLSLDDQHTGDMDFEKFCQAFQWLGIEAPIEDMRRTFARMDANASGLIDEQEFLLAVCDIDHSRYTPKFQLDFLMDRLAGIFILYKRTHCKPNHEKILHDFMKLTLKCFHMKCKNWAATEF